MSLMKRGSVWWRPIISVAEELALLDAAAKHLKEIIAFALDTGMRRIEILNQRWEDVDFFHHLLYVTRSKTPEGEAREIPLSEWKEGVMN